MTKIYSKLMLFYVFIALKQGLEESTQSNIYNLMTTFHLQISGYQ